MPCRQEELKHEIQSYLGLGDVTGVRVLIRYDVEDLSEDTFEKACRGIFAEPPVDRLYLEEFPKEEGDRGLLRGVPSGTV